MFYPDKIKLKGTESKVIVEIYIDETRDVIQTKVLKVRERN